MDRSNVTNDKAKSILKNWLNSDIYKDRLKRRTNEADNIIREMNKNVDNATIVYLNRLLDYGKYSGKVKPTESSILGYSWTTLSDRPITVLPYSSSLDTKIHEFSHNSDISLRDKFNTITGIDDDILGTSSKPFFDKNYYGDPTEIRARQNSVAARMYDKGLNPDRVVDRFKFRITHPFHDIFTLYNHNDLTNFREYGGILK